MVCSVTADCTLCNKKKGGGADNDIHSNMKLTHNIEWKLNPLSSVTSTF